MNRLRLFLTLVLSLFMYVASTYSAHAWPFIVSKFSAPFDQCKTCHISSSNLAMNPYGDDYMDSTHRSKYATRHPAIPVSGECNNCHGGKGYPVVQSGLDAMDSDLDLSSNQVEFSAGTFPGDGADFPADTSAPVITAFSLPAASSTLTVIVNTLTAVDDVAVAGYLLNVSGVQPAADDAGWNASAPTQFTFATADIQTLYAWARDVAGNISGSASAQVDTTSSQNRVNTPPSALGGDDQLVIEGATVTLDGGDSTDDLGIISYAWLQLDGSGGAPIDADDPHAVAISNPSDALISFVNPSVGNGGGILTFQLTVTDGDGAQDSAEVQVTVEDNGITDFDGMPGVISTRSAQGRPIGIGNTGANACTGLAPLDIADIAEGWQQPQDAIYGFIDFELKVNDHGNTSVTIYLPSPAPQGYKWYKYTEASGWFDFSRDLISDGSGDGAEFNADRTQVTIHITDNGEFDDNPAPDIIRDPGGLASGLSSSLSVGGNNFGGSSGGCFINASIDAAGCTRTYTFLGTSLFLFLFAGRLPMLRRKGEKWDEDTTAGVVLHGHGHPDTADDEAGPGRRRGIRGGRDLHGVS